jgi:predicted ATP-binding protein involved in virulence
MIRFRTEAECFRRSDAICNSELVSKKEPFLVRASATRVLGEYDHAFAISDGDEFVILYGPNGVGKTRFLEVVDALSRLRGSSLLLLPFETASLEYSDGSQLSAKRLFENNDAGQDATLHRGTVALSLRRPGQKVVSWTYGDDDFAKWIRGNLPYRQIGEDVWEDPADGEIVQTDELRERYGRRNPDKNAVPEALKSFAAKVPSYLIETQRLRIEQDVRPRTAAFRTMSGSRTRRPRSRITEQAEKLQQLVNEAQTEHSRITQRLDRTFPNRVLGTEATNLALDADSIRRRYDEQNEFRSRLGRVASVALEDELSLPARTLEDWELKLLDLYLKDADEKLAPFEGLLQKIELLEQIINSRLLNKELRVTDGDGLTVEHMVDARRIDLDFLSSGEQHEIILMIDLLFNVPRGAVVLIDEPEISLHIVWQLAFIPDVRRIATLAGFRFVVATHSPQIINDEWDRAIRLGPPEVAFS